MIVKKINMKYHNGQTVLLLNTEYKPVGNAIICQYQEISNKYEVDFTYPGCDWSDKITVPEDRLIFLED